MEQHNDNQASYSWWLDNHNRSHQSQWLQSTLTDLDKKTKMVLDIIDDNGDTFAKRAEMYYQKRPELIKRVEDLHKSYCVLANKYDQFRSSSNVTSLSNSFRQVVPLGDDILEREKRFNELGKEVSKLMDDYLEKQVELIRRNDEKRLLIKELVKDKIRLMEENRMLKDSLAEATHNKKSRMSKFKGAFFG